MKFNVSLAKILISENGITRACGGFASGEYILTVAHVFEGVQMNLYSYSDMLISNYFHVPTGINVHIGGARYVCSYAYIDREKDVAAIPLPFSCKKIPFRCGGKSKDYYVILNGSYEKINRLSDVSVGGQLRFSFDYSAEKGQSGYPIIDKSGYVNAVICSIDKMSGITYAIPFCHFGEFLGDALSGDGG